LAGNNDLRGVRDENSTAIHISDGNIKISDATTESKTLLPELVPILNTDTVLADCPGFGDTRGARYDIAAAVFTQQLLAKSNKVKIMATIAHHSVRKGMERSGFTNLLRHLVHFIKDIDKYADSIGLLVTKVENRFSDDGNGKPVYVTDNMIINEIGSFLQSVKTELMEKTDSDIAPKQIQLIDIFIAKSPSNEYSRIGIFRQPTRPDVLNLDQRLSKNKEQIERIMNTTLQPSRVEPNDFGLSLSTDSKYIMTKMRETLNTKLSTTLDEYIREYSKQPMDSADDNIEEMKTNITRLIAFENLLKSDIGPNMVVADLMDRMHVLDPG
jgi:hypothetical protein